MTNANNSSLFGTAFFRADNCTNLPTSSSTDYYYACFFGPMQVTYKYSVDGVTRVFGRTYVNSQWQPWTQVDGIGALLSTGGNFTGRLALATGKNFTQSPSETEYNDAFIIRDASSTNMGGLFNVRNTNGSWGNTLVVRDGNGGFGMFGPMLDQNHNVLYSVSNPHALRRAIHASSTVNLNEASPTGESIYNELITDLPTQQTSATLFMNDATARILSNTGNGAKIDHFLHGTVTRTGEYSFTFFANRLITGECIYAWNAAYSSGVWTASTIYKYNGTKI